MKPLSPKVLRHGLSTLRTILRRMRDDRQGGYHYVKDGKYAGEASFSSVGLPQTTPEELDALFALAGIVPDAIKVNGSCGECVFGDAKGGDLGWAQPCCACSRPKMTNFVSLASVAKNSLSLSDDQAQFLENVLANVWWATKIVTAKQFSKEWQKQLRGCYRTEAAMKKRDMMVQGLHGRRITRKGLLALDRYRRKHSTKKAA